MELAASSAVLALGAPIRRKCALLGDRGAITSRERTHQVAEFRTPNRSFKILIALWGHWITYRPVMAVQTSRLRLLIK